jgi:genome maintenance exonuclease 1
MEINELFTHIQTPNLVPKLKSQSQNGFRYYSVDGKSYPSVTSVLSILSKDGIRAWRDSIGHDVADFETRRAATRGIHFHKICENYLYNKNISEYKKKILSYGLFNLAKSEIDRIDNIYGMEKTLYSHSLKLAGRADCIAEFDNVLSIIDFKSANREKSPEILENHILQETAYAIMWNELIDIPIQQIVTIVACENGELQTVIEKPEFYRPKLESVIEQFNKIQLNEVKY